MVELPEECDFCELPRDDERDDEFVKLYLGDPPQPQPVTSRGISDRHIGGRREQHFQAIRNALQDMDGMDFEVYDHVREVKAIGGEAHFSKMADGGAPYWESDVNDDKTAAELRFHPEAREVEPDAMVCQECAEMFRSLSE